MIILKNNLRRVFKKKSNWIFIIILPLVVMSVLVASSIAANTYRIGISDNDKTEFTQEFINDLSKKYEIVYLEKDKIKDAVINSKVDYALVINKDTTDSLINGELKPIEAYSIKETNISIPLKIYVNSYMSAAKSIGEEANGSTDKFYEGINNYREGKFEIKETTINSNKAENEIIKRSLGFLVLSMVIILTFSATTGLKDRVNGIYTRILTGPIRKREYVIQNFISYTLIGIIQVFLVLIIMNNIIGLDIHSVFTELFIVFALFALCCISIGTFVARISGNIKKANVVLNVINIPMCMIGGCLWPIGIMPSFLQKISAFLPTTWALQAANKIVDGSMLFDVYKEIIILFIFTGVFLFGSVINISGFNLQKLPKAQTNS